MLRECAKCGFENPEQVDFCSSCGEYLRWEVSGSSRVIPADPIEVEAPRGDEPPPERRTTPYAAARAQASVLVALRLPDHDGTGGEVAATVDAGSSANVVAFVRNQSGIVDNYDLTVEGLPGEWWSIAPATVYLVPYGAASGEYEQEVTLTFHPPRGSDAQARTWPITVVATSRANAAPAGSADATLEIKPYHELEAEMRPERASARRRARYAIALRNKANAPVDVELSAVDPDGKLRFEFEQPRLSISPGRRNGSRFTVAGAKGVVFGRSVPHRFEICTKVIGSDAGALPKSGTFVQKAWISTWAVVLCALIAVGALAAYLLWPQPTTVPSLKGTEVFAAQQLLDEAGLELGNRTEKTSTGARPGTIVAQTPPAGEKVDSGEEVSIQVAVARDTTIVPDIVGLTLAAADRALSRAELNVGTVSPSPADPERSKILTQIPAAGAVAKNGSGVNVYFGVDGAGQSGDSPSATPRAVSTPADARIAAKAIGGDPREGTVEVPDLSQLASAQAARVLEQANLTPVAGVLYSGESRPGALVTQSPQAGTKVAPWTTVAYFYAAPYPELAFEAHGDLLTMNGGDGKLTGTLVKTPEVDLHPSWNPTGTRIAFRRGTTDQAGAIWLARRDGSEPKQLTDGGFDDRRPAISPDGEVIAFVRGSLEEPADARDFDLCFVKVSGGDAACKPDDGFVLHRPAWSTNGSVLFVPSQRRTGAQTRELAAYTSSKPSSPDPEDWRRLGAVSARLRPVQRDDAVYSAAMSPDGKTVALSATWGTATPHLVLATWNGRALSKLGEFRRIRSCELSWRPDGGELALDQRGDTCDSSQKGSISRFDPSHPMEVQLTTAGQNVGSPAWAPAG